MSRAQAHTLGHAPSAACCGRRVVRRRAPARHGDDRDPRAPPVAGRLWAHRSRAHLHRAARQPVDVWVGRGAGHPEDEGLDDRANTAFVWRSDSGWRQILAIAACSPLIASFFDEPQLIGIISALGASFFLRSLGITHYALSQRSLDFRTRTIAEFSSVVSRGITGITFALPGSGPGAWSSDIWSEGGDDARAMEARAVCPKLRSRRDHIGDCSDSEAC